MSQFNSLVATTISWPGRVHNTRSMSNLGFTQLRKAYKEGMSTRRMWVEEWRWSSSHKVIPKHCSPINWCWLVRLIDQYALIRYQSLRSCASPVLCALSFYALASSSSTPALAVLCTSVIKKICLAIPNIALAPSLNIIHAIVECLAQRIIIAS